MLTHIAGALALSLAAAALPSAGGVDAASANATGPVDTRASAALTTSDPNRNRYCDHFDAPPPSGRAAEFEVGNGLTAQVNTDLETVSVRSEAGPTWDSTITGIDRYSIGPGWTFGEAFVDVTDWGAKIYVPGHGLMESDQTSVRGLSCYDGRDVIFRWDSGVVPGRGTLPDRAYMSTLAHFDEADLEIPIRTDYFGSNGEVIASIDVDGTRTDRVYDADQPQRLIRIVHDDGRETTVSHLDSAGIAVTSPAGEQTRVSGYQARGHAPASIVSSAGSTSFKWDMMYLVSELVSFDASGLFAHCTEYNWLPDDAGRLGELRVDGERVFPLEPRPAP